jgi:hypothetical protein
LAIPFAIRYTRKEHVGHNACLTPGGCFNFCAICFLKRTHDWIERKNPDLFQKIGFPQQKTIPRPKESFQSFFTGGQPTTW